MRLYRVDDLNSLSVERVGDARALSIDGEVFLYVIGTTGRTFEIQYTSDLNEGGWIGRQGYSGVVLIGPDFASARDMDASEADDRSVLVAFPGDAKIIHSSLRECSFVWGGANPLETPKVRLAIVSTEGRLAFTFEDRQTCISVDETGTIWEEHTSTETGRVLLRLEECDFGGFARDLWGNYPAVTA